MKYRPYSLGCILSCTLVLPLAIAAPPAKTNLKLSSDAASAPASQMQRVIIQYWQKPGSAQENAILLAGGSIQSTLHSIHAHVATLPASTLQKLAADPNVRYISVDRGVAARQSVTVAGTVMTSANYTTEPINAPQVWAKGYDGTGIGVAVIDSGINLVDDLGPKLGNGPRIVYSQSYVPATTAATSPLPIDQYGHGTHVAGLIAGNGADSTGPMFYRTFSGAAPNANLINLRVLDQNGSGTDSQVIAAIEQAIALQQTYNIRVINLSLGRPIYESYTLDPLCQAVEQAWKAGIVVVVAAGNDGRDLNLNAEGYGTIEAPGNDPYVVTVGAMNTMQTPGLADDIIASYSSKGPSFIDDIAKPDIVAPGNLVTSLKYVNDSLALENPTFETLYGFYISNIPGVKSSAQYFPLSGTSMATGVASGAVALLLQAEPNLTPDQVKAFLMRDADRSYFPQTSSVTDPTTGIVYNANYDAFTIGAGYLDINAALNDVQSGTVVPAGTAMSPSLWSPTRQLCGAQQLCGARRTCMARTPLSAARLPSGEQQLSGVLVTLTPSPLYGAQPPSGVLERRRQPLPFGVRAALTVKLPSGVQVPRRAKQPCGAQELPPAKPHFGVHPPT